MEFDTYPSYLREVDTARIRLSYNGNNTEMHITKEFIEDDINRVCEMFKLGLKRIMEAKPDGI